MQLNKILNSSSVNAASLFASIAFFKQGKETYFLSSIISSFSEIIRRVTLNFSSLRPFLNSLRLFKRLIILTSKSSK